MIGWSTARREPYRLPYVGRTVPPETVERMHEEAKRRVLRSHQDAC